MVLSDDEAIVSLARSLRFYGMEKTYYAERHGYNSRLDELKAVGDEVKRGEAIVEVETDKSSVEMEALQSGTLAEIVSEPGDEVAVGAVIGYIESAD